MATAVQRYQLYVSHVGDETRSFLASLDAQPEEDVRATLDNKGFGRRMHLARIWMDFRKKIRLEADDEACLHRINLAIEADGRVIKTVGKDEANVKVKLPPRNSVGAFISGLKNFLFARK